MATIITPSLTLRTTKGSPLTSDEVDANFSNINSALGTGLTDASYTAADVLTKLLTVDTDTSGLNATTLKGLVPVSINTVSTVVSRDSSGNFAANTISATTISATNFEGVGTNLTGTATAFTASNVTTNANLTGMITSVGNATSLGSFNSSQLATALTNKSGSGLAVFATSPTLVTPALGIPSSGTLTNCTGLPAAGVVGTAAILGANIFTGSQIGSVTPLFSASGNIVINLANNCNFSHTTTENTTLNTPSNPVAGQSGVIVITQGATPRTLVYSSFYKFARGTAPTLTSTAFAVDSFAYYVESATRATCQLIKDVK